MSVLPLHRAAEPRSPVWEVHLAGIETMTAPVVTLSPHIGAALEAVTDADREWFEAHPHRAYRLRHLQLGEVLPGQTARPGLHIVVIRMGSPLVRMRLPVDRPPAHLRRDTDRTCAELIGRMVALGYTINGRPLGEVLVGLRASLRRALA
jgi:hypothetical protein